MYRCSESRFESLLSPVSVTTVLPRLFHELRISQICLYWQETVVMNAECTEAIYC